LKENPNNTNANAGCGKHCYEPIPLARGGSVPPYEELFQRLQDVAELNRLIGKTEDLHLDCKIWPQKDEDAQRILAKALCGFANADGGVIIIGLEARSGPNKYDPDIIQGTVPLPDSISVKSRVEGLVGDLVEPRLQGVMVAAAPEAPGAKSGFVLGGVPASDGPPCRSRKHRDFYQRITAGTCPMEYFQIADMFGKRHRPLLSLHLEEGRSHLIDNVWERELNIGIENRGRAVADSRVSGLSALVVSMWTPTASTATVGSAFLSSLPNPNSSSSAEARTT
jgi:hypothetical protein